MGEEKGGMANIRQCRGKNMTPEIIS